MPRRKTMKRKIKRRRKAGAKLSSGVLTAGGLIPRNRTVKLRYCQNVNLVCTTGVVGVARFRANGIYDPDYTGAGHQPYLSDQMAQFYNHYEVQNSRISIRAMNQSAVAGVPSACGVYLADDTITAYDWTTFKESGRGQSIMLNSANTEGHIMGTQYSLKKFYTGKLNNNAAVTADPTEQAFYVIYVQTNDTTSTGNTVSFEVTIDYTVKYYEPKDIGAS